jgi:GT2 family glycosyltransferase
MFHDTVRQVVAQSFHDWELWIVDQSGPGQRAANESFLGDLADARIQYLHLDVKGLPNARNEGLARVTAPIVLFLDDDVILLTDRFLDAHLDAYADARVGGVTGRCVERSVRPNVAGTAGHLSWGGRTLTNLWGTEPGEIGGLKGANMSYRMEAARQVGGFDRNYTGTALLEDSDYSHRVRVAGWMLRFEPAAELVHLSAPSGGVRVEDRARAETWRFRNTGYFVARHRGAPGVAAFLVTFAAIAAKRAVEWGRPNALVELMDAAREGIAAGAGEADTGVPGWARDG